MGLRKMNTIRTEYDGICAKELGGQTATTMAADVYATLPPELRMAALCLRMPENLARAA
jgi:hypothetical protein